VQAFVMPYNMYGGKEFMHKLCIVEFPVQKYLANVKQETSSEVYFLIYISSPNGARKEKIASRQCVKSMP
jgi:hypothetical protein